MSLPDHTPVATSWQDVLDALVAIVDTGEAFLDRLDAPSTEARVFVSLAATPVPSAFDRAVTVGIATTATAGRRKPLSPSFDPDLDGFAAPVNLLSLCGTAHAALSCRPLLLAFEASARQAAALLAARLAADGLTVGFVKAHRPHGEDLWIEQASLDGLPVAAGTIEDLPARLAATTSAQQDARASERHRGPGGPLRTFHMRRNGTEKDLYAIQSCPALFRNFATRPSVVAASADEARARIVAHDALLADRGIFRLPPSFGELIQVAPETMPAMYGTPAPMPPAARA